MRKKLIIKICLEFSIPFIIGILIAITLLQATSLSIETLHWFYSAILQAFIALLGLIGLIVAFKIQHIRDQIRDIQSAVIEYSNRVFNWSFAGFDIEEINRRKETLFEIYEKNLEKIPQEEQIKLSLEAIKNEKARFDEMLYNYNELEKERKEIYIKIFCPINLIVGIIIISVVGLIFSEAIYTSGIYILFGTAALVIWSISRIGNFLITMMLRERKIRVFVTVDVKDKT